MEGTQFQAQRQGPPTPSIPPPHTAPVISSPFQTSGEAALQGPDVFGCPAIVPTCICTGIQTFVQLLPAVFAKTISFTINPQACMVSELFNTTFQEAVNNGMGCK